MANTHNAPPEINVAKPLPEQLDNFEEWATRNDAVWNSILLFGHRGGLSKLDSFRLLAAKMLEQNKVLQAEMLRILELSKAPPFFVAKE